MITAEKRITRATFKSFINKHRGNLFIDEHTRFDGMVDCVTPVKNGFRKATVSEPGKCYLYENDLGIKGIWLVGSSRDYFTYYEDEIFTGIHCSNCCGSFTVTIIK